MPLTGADLMMPKGPVDAVLFPNTPVNIIQGYVDQYLTNAYADARVAAQTDADLKDQLARNWALYQVFQGVANRMSAEPLTVTDSEKGSTGYSAAQIANIQAQADKYLDDFLGLLSVSGTAQPLPGTVSTDITISW
jgi:hypothetical protein